VPRAPVGGTDYEIFRIDTVAGYEKLPFSLKVLLENLLRTEDGANVTKAQIEASATGMPRGRHRDPVHARAS
jgi:aconitate hydratase